jgi:hypothetical protein
MRGDNHNGGLAEDTSELHLGEHACGVDGQTAISVCRAQRIKHIKVFTYMGVHDIGLL